jgi:Cation/multidrug efflux pump
MVKNLIKRPIAVTMCIIAILILGGVAISMLPVSLMPNVDIPQITIQISNPGANARDVNDNLIQPIRNQLTQLSDIKEMRCEANNGGGIIFIEFEYGSNLDYNFIEVNEKIDRAYSSFPKELERPKVIKASATDIPAFFIDLTIKEGSKKSFMELSKFAKEVISKRIEQVEQVALVDVSGIQGTQILIEPYIEKIKSLNISVENLGDAIVSSNVSLGNLTIKDGYYQWNVRFDSQINSKEDVEKIVLKINDRVYKFNDLAKVSIEEATPKGMVRSGDKRSVTFAVIKQNDAQMSDLKNQLNKLINNFNNEYKDINFTVSRNQTELLDYSINNLKSNIIVGAILAVLVIFFFLKDFKSPMLVVITIPLSLVISLLALYLLGISINIISLSGLILGIGMMVDNSIIVIDNITQYWERFRYKDLDKAIVKGTVEVITPMLSSVLTTCSVFIPLIFLSGIAGSLFYDQAMGVTVALFSSFFISIIVIPVYYRIFYKKSNKRIENKFLKNYNLFLMKESMKGA